MSDRQLVKYRAGDSLFRVRWYGYGQGVSAVLERFDGAEWQPLDTREEGAGAPSGREESAIEDWAHDKIAKLYEPGESIETVDGAEWRRR